jgi:hypothetical protein
MAVALDLKDLNTFTAGVSPTPSRHRFTAPYKREILAQATRCTQAGELGALLRRKACTPRISLHGVLPSAGESCPQGCRPVAALLH